MMAELLFNRCLESGFVLLFLKFLFKYEINFELQWLILDRGALNIISNLGDQQPVSSLPSTSPVSNFPILFKYLYYLFLSIYIILIFTSPVRSDTILLTFVWGNRGPQTCLRPYS